MVSFLPFALGQELLHKRYQTADLLEASIMGPSKQGDDCLAEIFKEWSGL